MPQMDRLGGALAAAGPLLALAAERLGAVPAWPPDLAAAPWRIGLLGAASLLVSVAGGLLRRAHRRGLLALLAGTLAFFVVVANELLVSPAATLALASSVAFVGYLAAPVAAQRREPIDPLRGAVLRARAACATALFGGLLLAMLGDPRPLELAGVAGSLAVAWLTVLVGLFRAQLGVTGLRIYVLGFAAVGSVLSAIVSWGHWAEVVGGLALLPLAALLLVRDGGRPSAILRALADGVLSHPARMLVVTFLLLSLGGTVLLKLPLSAASGRVVSGIDALFTSTSAVCVTGLIVLDTPRDFSLAGQAILLLLIQLGGLGIMSFSTAAFALLGRRLSLRHEGAIADLMAHHRGDVFHAVKRMLLVTFGAELGGTLCLWALFLRAGDGVAVALWRALFTAVSAFCNAGFAVQTDSLIGYQATPAILHVIAVLVVMGGLSPVVVVALPRLVRGKSISIQSRLVLITSASLLVGGALVLGALEWSNTLSGLSWWDRMHNAWFQSVTTRTAGFNSVDIAALRPATIWIMTALMFIGGSPGGTAGGVKTTTVAVLLVAVRCAMRGRWEAVTMGRRLTDATVYKAAALITLAGLAVVVAMVALQVTQSLPFDASLFEAVSALATVGLSMGATAMLDDVGKVIVAICMFVGRVGPLTLFFFLRERDSHRPWRLPASDVEVG